MRIRRRLPWMQAEDRARNLATRSAEGPVAAWEHVSPPISRRMPESAGNVGFANSMDNFPQVPPSSHVGNTNTTHG
eukprot:7610731-Pyramimonas_sp.AAC.2